MKAEGAVAEKSRVGATSRGLRLYLALLAVQTAGVVILLANMIPLYRLMALDFANYRPDLAPAHTTLPGDNLGMIGE